MSLRVHQNKQTDRQTGRQTDRQANRQADKQTNRQTEHETFPSNLIGELSNNYIIRRREERSDNSFQELRDEVDVWTIDTEEGIINVDTGYIVV